MKTNTASGSPQTYISQPTEDKTVTLRFPQIVIFQAKIIKKIFFTVLKEFFPMTSQNLMLKYIEIWYNIERQRSRGRPKKWWVDYAKVETFKRSGLQVDG